MNDHIAGEDLAAYVDGLLSTHKKSDLESHFSRCPACLDELVEIATIMRCRDRIPSPLLTLALGEKSKAAKPVLHLRLVFEVAAVFVVVIFIGYLFLSGNRFWQAPEQKKPSELAEGEVQRAGPSAALRERESALPEAQRPERAAAVKTKSTGKKTAAKPGLGDTLVLEKMENVAADKGLPAGDDESLQGSTPEHKLRASVEEQPQPAAVNEGLPKKELDRSASTSGAVGAGSMDFAVKDRKAAREIEGKAVVAVLPPFRIEGEADLNDLLNPELLSAWTWMKKGMVLELQIDSAGVVTAVSWSKDIDPLVGKQADSEAKKLLFSVSEKKLRRARLSVGRPNPAELGKSLR